MEPGSAQLHVLVVDDSVVMRRIVARTLVGVVTEDRGRIGVGGGQLVHVSVRGAGGGDFQNMDWPADELTIIRRAPSRK